MPAGLSNSRQTPDDRRLDAARSSNKSLAWNTWAAPWQVFRYLAECPSTLLAIRKDLWDQEEKKYPFTKWEAGFGLMEIYHNLASPYSYWSTGDKFLLFIFLPTVSDFVMSKAKVYIMLEFALPIHTLAAAGLAKKTHKHALNAFRIFSIFLMQGYILIQSLGGDFSQSRNLQTTFTFHPFCSGGRWF